MNSKWSLDNFNIELTKTDEGLLIQAEDQLQGNLYSKLLDSESIKTISTDPFFDLETLHQVLSDFFEKKPENTYLTIFNNGKLHHSCKVFFGNIVKKFEFNIQLEKQEIDPLTKLENQIKKLSLKMIRLENERNAPMNDVLLSFEKTLLEKLGKIEEVLARTETRVTRLEEKRLNKEESKTDLIPELHVKPKVTQNSKTASNLNKQKDDDDDDDFELDRSSAQPQAKPTVTQDSTPADEWEELDDFFEQHQGRRKVAQNFKMTSDVIWEFYRYSEMKTRFKLSNDFKTASSLGETPCAILAKQFLPKRKTSKFTFLIGNSSWIMVGITTENYLDRGFGFNDPAAFGYAHNGDVYRGGNQQDQTSKYKQGDQLSFTCDMKTGKIQVFLNNNLTCNHTISKQNLESYSFHPFIYTNSNSGVGATFI